MCVLSNYMITSVVDFLELLFFFQLCGMQYETVDLRETITVFWQITSVADVLELFLCFLNYVEYNVILWMGVNHLYIFV